MAIRTLRATALAALVALAAIGPIGTTAATARATKVPAGVTAEFLYGPDPNQLLDIYESPNANSPVVVTVHGGGFAPGSKKGTVAKIGIALQPLGFTVVNINYRLDSPTQVAFPMEVQDVEAAVAWTKAHIAAYNGSPTNISLLGDSAGGNLAGQAALGLGGIHHVVTLSGPLDFPALQQNAIAGTMNPAEEAHESQAFGCPITSCSLALLKQYSPVDQVTLSNCPGSWLILKFCCGKNACGTSQQHAISPDSERLRFDGEDRAGQAPCDQILGL